jgi:hypothetical protein
VRLEQRRQPLRDWHRIILESPPLGLPDDLLQPWQDRREVRRQPLRLRIVGPLLNRVKERAVNNFPISARLRHGPIVPLE